VAARLEEVEIMFHVGPLLPFAPNDPQQIERKVLSDA
jgi:hypothetical protein